jgi:chemosensory pili system protein ChpA (sensor histidine kinase/response regulator)
MKNHLQAMEKQFQLLRHLADELEQLVDLKDLAGKFLNQESAFDTLEMDQYSELHTASRRMVEAAFDARELSLDTGRELEEMGRLLEDQQRLVNETQETIMKTRLVPVSSISQRLQRSLRQTSRLTGKQCQLQVSGEHLLVDGDTLNNLIDPLMHLLRNAVDHGIEDEDSRIALGKPAHGNIAISFDRDGNNIVVRIKDDGKGLDYAAIRAAAERRGAIAPDQQVSEDDLKRLILKPNFSTRTQTTQTSGRGVGMDVVHHQVLTQGGTLTLQSEYGKGLDVAMSIPLPLSRAHALLTHIGPYQVAVSSKGIKQILFVAADALSLHDGRYYLQLQDDNYPAVYLANLMNISVPDRSAKKLHTVLLVQNNEQITAVLLDAITDSLDVIIKSLGHYIKKIPGYTGAAIMGDGSVAPVLDLPELIRTADASLYANQDLSDDSFIASPASHLPTVLVVDDSLSQRRALEQLLEDAGFQVKTARDGMDAADQLVEFIPDIVLTDLEMPRMNGIELATHIRSRENLKHLPVIMITSRTTQAHRKLAEEAGINAYLVKPVREDDLLENIQMALANPAMA